MLYKISLVATNVAISLTQKNQMQGFMNFFQMFDVSL